MQDCAWWQYVISWPPCLHQALKPAVCNDIKWVDALWYPAYNLNPVRKMLLTFVIYLKETYLTSAFVCWWWEYVTTAFPTLSNAAVNVPSFSWFVCTATHATTISFVLSPLPIISSPQHNFMCFRKLPVDFASFLSRNQLMVRGYFPFPLQDPAMHSNVWMQQPSMY